MDAPNKKRTLCQTELRQQREASYQNAEQDHSATGEEQLVFIWPVSE